MIKKLLPLLSLIIGLAGGGGAAIVLAPPPDEQTENEEHADTDHVEELAAEPEDIEIVKLPNQFVIPVIMRNRVRAVVILTVALEVDAEHADVVRTLEPKLRDSFLVELFNLAALDGFEDELISRKTLDLVKSALTQRARDVLHQDNVAVLITDMARQDTH